MENETTTTSRHTDWERAHRSLGRALDADLPVVLWGPPGIGKSAACEAEAASRGWPIVVVPVGSREPPEIVGWARDRGGEAIEMVWPAWAARIAEASIKAGAGLLVLDEVGSCTHAVQVALLRILLDRVVGDDPLPPGIRIVATGNPPDCAAGGWELSAPAANRVRHLSWPTPSIEEWCQWLLSRSVRDDETDRTWRGPQGQRARALIAGLLQRRPALLLQLPADEASRSGPWPSPRSWEMAARSLATCTDRDGTVDLDDAVYDLSQCIGSGPAAEALAWLRDADLPDPRVLLDDPDAWQIPVTRTDRVWAALGAVYGYLVASGGDKPPSRRDWDAAWRLADRCRDAGQSGAAIAALGRPLAKMFIAQEWAGKLPIPDGVMASVAFDQKSRAS